MRKYNIRLEYDGNVATTDMVRDDSEGLWVELSDAMRLMDALVLAKNHMSSMAMDRSCIRDHVQSVIDDIEGRNV